MEPVAERERLLDRRPLAGRLAAFQAKCADHFAEEPVVAPHPRFHPVPTRPVFAPVPPEELAMLLAPPEPADDAKPSPEEAQPAAKSPVPPTDVPNTAPPTRTARSGVAAKPVSTAAPAAPAISTPGDSLHGEIPDDEPAAGQFRSTFGTPPTAAPHRDDADDGSVTDEPLLWRAMPTPAGALRAVPADFESVM